MFGDRVRVGVCNAFSILFALAMTASSSLCVFDLSRCKSARTVVSSGIFVSMNPVLGHITSNIGGILNEVHVYSGKQSWEL